MGGGRFGGSGRAGQTPSSATNPIGRQPYGHATKTPSFRGPTYVRTPQSKVRGTRTARTSPSRATRSIHPATTIGRRPHARITSSRRRRPGRPRDTRADRFYVSLASDRLRSASNAFHVTAQEWRQNGLRAQVLLENPSKMLNSNENSEMDESFNLSVVHVRPPPRGTGRKRSYVPGHQSNVRLKQVKRSVVEMRRNGWGWCAVRAIVTARELKLAGSDENARKKWRDP